MSVVGGASAGGASALSARSLSGCRRFLEIAHQIKCRACRLCNAVECWRQRDHIRGRGLLEGNRDGGNVCVFAATCPELGFGVEEKGANRPLGDLGDLGDLVERASLLFCHAYLHVATT